MRQKEPAPSAEVRRKTPEVVRAPPDMSSYVAGVARARGRVQKKVVRDTCNASLTQAVKSTLSRIAPRATPQPAHGGAATVATPYGKRYPCHPLDSLRASRLKTLNVCARPEALPRPCATLPVPHAQLPSPRRWQGYHPD